MDTLLRKNFLLMKIELRAVSLYSNTSKFLYGILLAVLLWH
jgi:hypothetical protein